MDTGLPPRARVKALAQGRSDGRGIAIPLAGQFAARINERDWEDFIFDPTQLANGLRDLVDAVSPDGVQVTIPEALTEPGLNLQSCEHLQVALEATRRLRSSMGERVALLACLPSATSFSGGAATLTEVTKEFLAAGADVIYVLEPNSENPEPLSALANIARFHQAVAVSTDSRLALAPVSQIPLTAPCRADGVAVTETKLPRDIDLHLLEEWIDAVRG
ncbi:hypothetical protein [Mycobacterium sp. OAE908]|uniref:hypothetical protein n=1 Tax=Mycobacterium sp. OAE908 TaxID=2817899 RepID=UPI001AE181A7